MIERLFTHTELDQRAMEQHAQRMGNVLADYYDQPIPAEIITKADQTPVLPLDEDLSRRTRAAFPRVACEEAGARYYGWRNAYYSDPIDGTADLIDGFYKSPRQSYAAYSLARVIHGRPAAGVVNFPVLDRRRTGPRLYSAWEGSGTMLSIGDDDPRQLEVDTEPTKGVVLVSSVDYPSSKVLSRQGFTVREMMGGAVFKATCLIDPDLAGLYAPDLIPKGERVIGYLSYGTWPHDVLATAVNARKAGAVVGNRQNGGVLELSRRKHGSIFANNLQVFNKILEAAQAA